MNIHWNQYVDHIYCISHERNKYRHADLIDTLKYANIFDSDIFKFIVSHDIEYNYCNLHNTTQSIYLDCIQHNYERILILEDDIRIIKDELTIINHLNNLPSNFNVCLLDYQIPKEYIDVKLFNDDDQLYFKYDYLYSTAAYVTTLDSCKKFIGCKYAGKPLDILFSEFFDNKFASKQNIFVQYEYSNRIAQTFDTKNNYINRNKLNLDNYYNYN